MVELILHGVGDYILQNDWMALNKKKSGFAGFMACFIHCLTYSLPFLFIGSFASTIAIFLSHFFIDRTNFVFYLIAIKNGVKKKEYSNNGSLASFMDTFPYMYDISNFGFSPDRPFAISVWLYIIVDNLLHLICNHISLTYF